MPAGIIGIAVILAVYWLQAIWHASRWQDDTLVSCCYSEDVQVTSKTLYLMQPYEEPDDEDEAEEVEEEEEDKAAQDGAELGDEEILRSAETEGVLSGGETDAEDMFESGYEALSLLQDLGNQQQATLDPAEQGEQPFEVLRSHRRRLQAEVETDTDWQGTGAEGAQEEEGAAQQASQGGRKRGSRGSSAFDPGADDVWNKAVAAHLGMGPKPRRRGKGLKRGRPVKGKGSRSKAMSEEAAAHLAAGSLLYAEGKFDEAIPRLKEVIRLAPNFSDGYERLGIIYEEQKDLRRSLNALMLAATIKKKDRELWKRLFNVSIQLNYYRQAIHCLDNVLARWPEDAGARWDRAVLYGELGEPRKAIRSLDQLRRLDPASGQVAQELARKRYELKDLPGACATLEAFLAHPEAEADLTHYNMLCELFLERRDWAKVLEWVERAKELMCGAEGLPIDLSVKAGLSCAHLAQDPSSGVVLDQALDYLKHLLMEPVDQNGDLYESAAKSLQGLHYYPLAITFLEPLHGCAETDTPDICRQLAECHLKNGEPAAAVTVYESIVDRPELSAEDHTDLVLAMVEALIAQGQPHRAEVALQRLQGPGANHSRADSPEVLLRRADMVLKLGHEEAYLDMMLPVLANTLKHFGQLERMSATAVTGTKAAQAALRRRAKLARKRMQAAPEQQDTTNIFKGYVSKDPRLLRQQARDSRLLEEAAAVGVAPHELMSDSEPESGNAAETMVLMGIFRGQKEFEALVQSCRLLAQQGQLKQATQLVHASLDTFAKRWLDRSKRDVLRMILAEIAEARGDHLDALALLRCVTDRWPTSVPCWNMYSRVAASMGGIKQASKFLLPLKTRCPRSLPLLLLAGQSYLMQGQWDLALHELFQAYQLAKEEPLVMLCLSVALLQKSMSRKAEDRNKIILQAFAFMQEYGRRCGNQLEADYNMARATHFLGMMHIAAQYYERVLAVKDVEEHDLKQEAAHNLSQIYQGSGAGQLAKQVLRQHCRF
eukprot:jgi/Astpho2/1408/Aster-06258